MDINLKRLEEAMRGDTIPSIDTSIEAIDVVELVKDFSSKILDFLTQIRSSAAKIREQLDTFSDVKVDIDPSLLNQEVYGYSQERFNFLVTRYVNASKDVRSVVRYLARNRLDNAAKMADRVAIYLDMRNDVFKLKKNPEVEGRIRSTLKDLGFNVINMVEHRNSISEILKSESLDQLRKEVEREMSKAGKDDSWPNVAYKFSSKAINELAEIAIELGNQQLKMLKILSK